MQREADRCRSLFKESPSKDLNGKAKETPGKSLCSVLVRINLENYLNLGTNKFGCKINQGYFTKIFVLLGMN